MPKVETLKDSASTFLDVGSYTPLRTGWISAVALMKFVEQVLWRRRIPVRDTWAGVSKQPFNQLKIAKLLSRQATGTSVGSALLYALSGAEDSNDLGAQFRASETALGNLLFAPSATGAIGDSGPQDQAGLAIQVKGALEALACALECINEAGSGKAAGSAVEELLKAISSNVDARSGCAPPAVELSEFLRLFVSGNDLAQFLSPIGLLSTIRYHFVARSVVAGPVQQVVALAPKESVELVTESTLRRVREDEFEEGMEQESKRDLEDRNNDELTDLVSKTISRSVNTSLTVGGGGTIGVVSANVSSNTATADVETSSVQNTHKAVRETTMKTSDRLKRTTKIKVKNVLDSTEVNSSRRLISNPSETDVMNVVVRQPLRSQTIIAQHVAQQLCWQCTLENPGRDLRIGVYRPQFEDTSAYLSQTGAGAGNLRADGRSTVDASQQERIAYSGKAFSWDVEVKLPEEHALKPGTRPTIVSADVTHTAAGTYVGNQYTFGLAVTNAKPLNTTSIVKNKDPAGTPQTRTNDNAFLLTLSGTFIPTGHAVDNHLRIDLTVDYEFTASVYANSLDADADATREKLRYESYARRRNDESAVESRPARDLREEERMEISRRVLLERLGMGAGDSSELDYLRSLFDIDAMFYALPELLAAQSVVPEEPNSMLRESEYMVSQKSSARFGESFHWGKRQVDGDRTRDLFINARFAQVRVPIRPGREAEAISWLQSQVEGELMADSTTPDLLRTLCDTLAARDLAKLGTVRDQDGDLPDPGDVPADTSACKSLTEALRMKDGLTLETLFPIIDRFMVTTPVDGAIYEMYKP